MKPPKVVNHMGIWINSDIPTTGVLSLNRVNWEAVDYNEIICLTCEEAYNEIESDENLTEEEKEELHEFSECDSCHTKLWGDWLKDEKGLYYPDESGEFAAIEGESVLQIIWSRFVSSGHNYCSPCYPGQIDLDSEGDFRAFTLPPDLLYDEE